MSTVIQQSLGNLYYAIEKLEAAATAASQQPQDLFSRGNASPAVSRKAAANSAAAAKRIDNAIGKLEILLKEGSNG